MAGKTPADTEYWEELAEDVLRRMAACESQEEQRLLMMSMLWQQWDEGARKALATGLGEPCPKHAKVSAWILSAKPSAMEGCMGCLLEAAKE